MVTVALIGADGSGKTTLARALERGGELPIQYVYMGVNGQAASHMLPSTRVLLALKRCLGLSVEQGGPPDPARRRERRHGLRGLLSGTRAALSLANRVC